MKTTTHTITLAAIALAAILALAGCTTSSDGDGGGGDTSCPRGEVVAHGGDNFCIVIEDGFLTDDCPEAFPNGFGVEEIVVCADADELPGDIEDTLRERGFLGSDDDNSNNQGNNGDNANNGDVVCEGPNPAERCQACECEGGEWACLETPCLPESPTTVTLTNSGDSPVSFDLPCNGPGGLNGLQLNDGQTMFTPVIYSCSECECGVEPCELPGCAEVCNQPIVVEPGVALEWEWDNIGYTHEDMCAEPFELEVGTTINAQICGDGRAACFTFQFIVGESTTIDVTGEPIGGGEVAACENTGGTWDETSCGHYTCGQAPACEAIVPGCDCGLGRTFDREGGGCLDDLTCAGDGGEISEVCTGSGGRWDEGSCGDYVCGDAPNCEALIPGCDCGEGQIFDRRAGCQPSDTCDEGGGASSQAQCEDTGGSWDELSCGDYVCGVAPACRAIIPGCDCGRTQVFDQELGCVESAECNGSGAQQQMMCEDTGGTWDETSCGDYTCGQAPACEAIIPGCDCGATSNFDPDQGCVTDEMCR